MANQSKAKPLPISFTRIISGIADYDKESPLPDAVAFIRQIDFRTNPRRWTILPRTVKESGSTITDLPVAGDRIVDTVYLYGDTGNIYTRSLAGVVTLVRSVSNSSGNGFKYFGEDGFAYYTGDKTLGRYGRIGSSPTWVDDFLTAEGGVPLNTHSLDLEAGSSQYATAADSATVSITGDLAMEINFKPESLPTAGNEMVLMSKWNENTNRRSYKFSVYAISGYFSDGTDGALTISANTTEAPIDSACSGTSGNFTLTATNAGFAADQIILIHQTQGTGHGTWQRNKIVSYTAGTITLETALNYSYSTGAQVRVMPRYTTVTVNSGKTYSAKAWNGTVGGILAFVSNNTVTATGAITAAAKGFRGGAGEATGSDVAIGYSGESTTGAGSHTTSANGTGGGGAKRAGGTPGAGGGGHATAGSGGLDANNGTTSGDAADLTTADFGGAGGGSAANGGFGTYTGGNSGGFIFITAVNLVVTASTGSISANGGTPGGSTSPGLIGAGGGSGGSILLKVQTATLETSLVTANGGAAGASESGHSGGAGGNGRIHLDYLTSFTGTTSPALDSAQDNSLVTTVTYQLRLQLSSNGTAVETLAKNLVSITVGTWSHLAVSWDASDHEAEFIEDGNSLGSAIGSATSLNDNNSLFTIGASFDSGGSATGFADGKVDDLRLWASERTVAQIVANKQVEIATNSPNLNAYWQVDNSTSDSTANANNLTLVNTPVYSTDVPFSSPTTRLDIDQQDTSTGDTYALPQTIDEGAAHRQSFIPAKDPQKSIGIYVSDTGDDSDWTLTVHDPQNRTIASKTLTHAQLTTGHNEFIFDNVWRPVVGATYHFHLVATTATGTPLVVAGTNNNLETGEFKSYYQFLVEDEFHEIEHTGNFLSIANERYVATWDASSYDPHRLIFPAGWRVRAIGRWNEYYAYGCFRGDSISDYDSGIIFFWDGFSTTYNFFIDVPEGGINALFGSQGTLYIVAGYQGDLLEYTGGNKATKVKRLPKITADKYIEVLPNAINMWRTLLHIGAGVTDSSDFEQGVYSYGSLNRYYNDALSFDYAISTGVTQNTGVKIGLVMPVEKKLLIGFKSNLAYGLDSVDPAGSPYPEGSIEFMIRDEGGIWKEKRPDVIRADFDPLVDGQSIGIQYKLDRASNWTTEVLEDTEDATVLRVQPSVKLYNNEVRHRDYQIRLNLKTDISTSPAGLGLTMMEDPMTDEAYV